MYINSAATQNGPMEAGAGAKSTGTTDAVPSGDSFRPGLSNDAGKGSRSLFSAAGEDAYKGEEEEQGLLKYSRRGRSTLRRSPSSGRHRLGQGQRLGSYPLAVLGKALALSLKILAVSFTLVRLFRCVQDASVHSISSRHRAPSGGLGPAGPASSSSLSSRRLAGVHPQVVSLEFYGPLGPPPVYSRFPDTDDAPPPADSPAWEPPPPYYEAPQDTGELPPPYEEQCRGFLLSATPRPHHSDAEEAIELHIFAGPGQPALAGVGNILRNQFYSFFIILPVVLVTGVLFWLVYHGVSEVFTVKSFTTVATQKSIAPHSLRNASAASQSSVQPIANNSSEATPLNPADVSVTLLKPLWSNVTDGRRSPSGPDVGERLFFGFGLAVATTVVILGIIWTRRRRRAAAGSPPRQG